MIGIIGAMEVEVAELKSRMENASVTKKAGMEFVTGQLFGQEAVLVRSGIGKVNAAACAQILCDCFGVTAMLNTGIAGALHPDIRIGDVVIATDALQHDMDAVAFGYAPGVIPQMPVSVFTADEALGALAEATCREDIPEIGVHRGRVVSGDQFVASREVKNRIVELFAGYCTEMEGAAIAQVAYLNEVPYMIIRAISDQADDEAGMDYGTFEALAIAHMVTLVEGMCKRMSRQ